MTGVPRKSNATAHNKAVHIGDIGLRKRSDAGVEKILLAPEHLAEIAADACALVKPANIATGAQTALARAFQ